MIKKGIMAVIMCVIFVSICGCGKQEVFGNGENISEEESTANTESVEELGMPDEDSFAIYQRFLDGEEFVYFREADHFEGKDLDLPVEAETPYGLGDICGIINQIGGGNDTMDEFADNISYAYIDCGADGNVELALKFQDIDASHWLEHVTLIIKDMDGRLEICYIMQPYYRESWELANVYGVVDYHVGIGTGLWGNRMEYIGADGVCRVVWDVFSDINTYWFFDLPEDFPYEIPEKTWIVLSSVSFGEPSRDPDYRDYDMLSLEKINGGGSDDGQEDSEIDIDDLSRAVMEVTGKELYSLEEIRALAEAREVKLGLTEEIKNGPEVEWIPFTGTIRVY